MIDESNCVKDWNEEGEKLAFVPLKSHQMPAAESEVDWFWKDYRSLL